MPKTRPPNAEAFRRDAVGLVRSGRSIRDVAESLGVSQQTLRNWVKQTQLDLQERDDGLTSDERDELRELRKRVRRLEQEHEILKRGAASSRGRPRPGASIAEIARLGGRRSLDRDELTPTKERVACLAAQGRPNREIAATLSVSERTVEANLTRAYRKLGVRSRTELARRLPVD